MSHETSFGILMEMGRCWRRQSGMQTALHPSYPSEHIEGLSSRYDGGSGACQSKSIRAKGFDVQHSEVSIGAILDNGLPFHARSEFGASEPTSQVQPGDRRVVRLIRIVLTVSHPHA
jgi:hypothetical protein